MDIHDPNNPRSLLAAAFGCLIALVAGTLAYQANEPKKALDPAGWGDDHVNKPLPMIPDSGGCLFCHRGDVGQTWSASRHQQTVREPGSEPAISALSKSPECKDSAGQVMFLLGTRQQIRFLKTTEQYGTVALLSTAWRSDGKDGGVLIHGEKPSWDSVKFGRDCVGCHMTGIDPKTNAYSALSLDCFVCHGDVPDPHAEDGGLALLSKRGKTPAEVTTSVCASCHARGGTSKSTGRPYPCNFVPGDNLFRDFQVDLSDAAIAAQNPGDAHVLANIRDVTILGKTEVTCVSCHSIHKQSSRKHRIVAESKDCLFCHEPNQPKRILKKFEVHSKTCEY